MKRIKQIAKILLIIVMLFTASIGKAGSKVEAAFTIEAANLYSKGSYGNMLRYNGVEVLTTFVVYAKDGIEYPAYCLDANMPGVGEKGSYTVNVTSLLNDVMLWRVITNGYPYKTVSQLGCHTKEEAFTATKQAVYCMIYGREASWYEPIGEQGVRVRNAMAQILQNARASTTGKPSNQIEINANQNEWKMDAIWNNWVSQTFAISASTSYNTYTVSIEGEYPEDTKILDEQNHVKTTFGAGERFKIAIQLKNLKQAGNFKINVTTKLNTKPVLYGKAPINEWQDYALTAASYEDAMGSRSISYLKNDTKIIIKKQDAGSLLPLEGVEFRILDRNQNPVYTNLVTNRQGRIELDNMLPGEYYLEEVKAKEGYSRYEGQIPFELTLNQTLTVTVNNNLEKKYEYVNNTQNITINNSHQETIVKDNQQYTSRHETDNLIIEQHNQIFDNTNHIINQKNGTYNLEISNSNINENNQNLNQNILNKNENINQNTQNQNTDINNQNTNTNENTQNQNTDINNQNTNVNENTQNQNIDVNNQNTNVNENTQNQNTDINNQNTNVNENTQNQNTDINNQNTNVNTNIQNQNENSNISGLNGVMRLPKTGM